MLLRVCVAMSSSALPEPSWWSNPAQLDANSTFQAARAGFTVLTLTIPPKFRLLPPRPGNSKEGARPLAVDVLCMPS